MKQIISITLLMIVPGILPACDICGRGAGNNYIGILPEYQKRIIGLRYRGNAMLTHVGAGGATTYLTTQETYRTMEIWAGWNINNRFRVMASLPYSFNQKNNQSITQRKNGVGDISVSGLYQLLNTRKTINPGNLLVQSLWIGAGIKLATGRYDPTDKSAVNQNTNLFQLGTGSYDINLNMMYDIRLQDAGVNCNTVYKINTANLYGYRYGNKISSSIQAYYKFRVQNKWTISPNAGFQYEYSSKDHDNSMRMDISGGRLFLGTIGMEAPFGKYSVGANWQTPISQYMGNGMVQANNRGMVHLAIYL